MANGENGKETPKEKRERIERDRADIRRQQEQRNWDRRQEAIEAAAAREAMERLEDEFLDAEFLRLTGMSGKEAMETLAFEEKYALDDPEVKEAIQAIKDATKAKEGGIFTSPNPEKAKGIIKKHQKAIRNSIKKGKKRKSGCIWTFAGLTATGLAALYGMYEGVSAVASSLF